MAAVVDEPVPKQGVLEKQTGIRTLTDPEGRPAKGL